VNVSLDHIGDLVLFELANLDEVEALAQRVEPRFSVWAAAQDRSGCYLLGVDLPPVEGDLALLLRTASRWIAERGLPELVVRLDGRRYVVLPAETADVTA